MHSAICFPATVLATALVAAFVQTASAAQCNTCHPDEVTLWSGSRHANTQLDLAGELAASHPGEAPADVIQGEDCIACHSPTAVLANGKMSEGDALGYFFTTTNGQFSASTSATNTSAWPHAGCAACHSVPTNHSIAPASLALFDSQTAHYVHVTGASELCGQCHGTLHFSGTDHQVYDAWLSSKHAHTQDPVAGELSNSHAGEDPWSVAAGENCIACHAPTAVLTTGGDEATALDYFFTSTNGLFTTSTASAHSDEWPGVGCTACHNPHDPGSLSYFNSGTFQYEVMTNSAQLCGQCHGNLRFPDTDHRSYNILQGTGGIGVPDQQFMGDVTCTDCHMHRSDADGSNSRMYGGHSWAITVAEAGGQSTMSCLACHTGADPATTSLIIDGWKSEFQTLDATASANVARAAAAVQAVENPAQAVQAALAEAQHNLAYAESDESGGFHNHPYLMALLQDANQKALSIPILNATKQGGSIVISWTGSGTLQAADSISGPWKDVSGATNPLVLIPSQPVRQQYYRLRP
jgi:formate-dependent nitrite reductase cytochrome c552 subunit